MKLRLYVGMFLLPAAFAHADPKDWKQLIPSVAHSIYEERLKPKPPAPPDPAEEKQQAIAKRHDVKRHLKYHRDFLRSRLPALRPPEEAARVAEAYAEKISAALTELKSAESAGADAATREGLGENVFGLVEMAALHSKNVDASAATLRGTLVSTAAGVLGMWLPMLQYLPQENPLHLLFASLGGGVVTGIGGRPVIKLAVTRRVGRQFRRDVVEGLRRRGHDVSALEMGKGDLDLGARQRDFSDWKDMGIPPAPGQAILDRLEADRRAEFTPRQWDAHHANANWGRLDAIKSGLPELASREAVVDVAEELAQKWAELHYRIGEVESEGPEAGLRAPAHLVEETPEALRSQIVALMEVVVLQSMKIRQPTFDANLEGVFAREFQARIAAKGVAIPKLKLGGYSFTAIYRNKRLLEEAKPPACAGLLESGSADESGPIKALPASRGR